MAMHTPPSGHSSRSGQSPEGPFRVVRKRNRVPLSCGPCRHRKLKCDRSAPCQNCVKRGDATSCAYATPSTKKRSQHGTSHSSPTSPDDMQNRIDRLEGLVLSLMTNGPQSAGPTAATAAVLSVGNSNSSSQAQDGECFEETQMLDGSDDIGYGDDSGDDDTDNVTQSFGVMKVDNETKKTVYIGESHWVAALHDIAEVRNYFKLHKKQFDEQCVLVAQTMKQTENDSGPALLFGASKAPPRSEILSQLPSRYLADILVARYFSVFDAAVQVVHPAVFRRQYEAHWADPSKTSLVWLAMLFAMMRIPLMAYSREGDEPIEFAGKTLDLSNTYRTAMAGCLILADYTKPHQFIIETLLLHLHSEYRRSQDTEASVWVLVGMIIRFAMRMGYHRDSTNFPNITPFQGEMRRRVWTFLRQADILFSFQMSLPSMIRTGDSDTNLPHNIYDEEFDEDTTVLPASRPPSERTTISYLITKARLALAFGRVLEEVNGPHLRSYDEVSKLDKELRDEFQNIPEHLKLRPVEEQRDIPVTQLIGRFQLAAIYHKSQCVLHRKFLRSARNTPRCAYSRRTCLESAMAIMGFQSMIHGETRKGGRLASKASLVTSLASHDFLLAASILSVDLYLEKLRADANAASASTSPRTNYSDSNSGTSSSEREAYGINIGMEHSQEDLLRALEVSQEIWADLEDQSMEAYKASKLLKMLLSQLKAPRGQTPPMRDDQQYSPVAANGVRRHVDEKQSAAMTLGLLSSGGKGTESGPGQQVPSQRGIGSMFENTSSIDGALQPGGPGTVPNGGVFDTQNAANGPTNFMGMFGSDAGGSMNLDWENFDSYLQSSNINFDSNNTMWNTLSPSANPFPTNTSNMDGNAPTGSSFFNYPAYTSNPNIMPSSDPGQKFGLDLDPSAPRAAQPPVENSAGRMFPGSRAQQGNNAPAWKWNSTATR